MANDKKVIKTADDVAAECLELQFSKSRESRFENLLLIVLTLGFVFFFAVFFWILPDKDFSEEENTTLSSFPEFTAEGFLHGDFTAEFAGYMADQFPLRSFFIGLKGLSETVQLKGQNNDVIFGSDGYLVARTDYPDASALEKNLRFAKNFISVAENEKNGIECTVALAGRKMDVMDEVIPSLYGTEYSDRLFSQVDTVCKDFGIDYLNLRDVLNAQGDKPLYYKTDHHWTSLGAYYAYCAIMTEMGITPYELSDFTVETATEEFYGTTWSTAGVKWAEPDTIEYYRYEGDDQFTLKIESPGYKYTGCEYVTENGKTYAVFDSVYIREMLEGKDKYASFLGGNNNGYVEIRKEGEERETLVLLRDSFADSLAPFLARHFDLVLLDLRTSSPDTIALCEELGADRILFLYNMETLTTTNDLSKLMKKLSSHR